MAEQSSTIALIRHAKAGDRDTWSGDDRQRPLTKTGRRQAADLVKLLAAVPLQRMLTSPYIRCVQTMQPLAEARGITLEETPALAESASLHETLALIAGLSGDAALCSHGDVIEKITAHLAAAGLIRGPVATEKGAMWLLRWAGDRFSAAQYVEAP